MNIGLVPLTDLGVTTLELTPLVLVLRLVWVGLVLTILVNEVRSLLPVGRLQSLLVKLQVGLAVTTLTLLLVRE